jgi:hypothetical protein
MTVEGKFHTSQMLLCIIMQNVLIYSEKDGSPFMFALVTYFLVNGYLFVFYE